MEEKKPGPVAVWNDKLEQVVLDIGRSSMAYKIMHISVAQLADKQYSRYMLAGIILGPLSGVISGIGVAVDSESITFPIIATILSFISGIVVAIIKFNKFDEVVNTNKIAAAKYTSLESNVRRQLGMYRNNRIQPGPYIEWLDNSYENLFSTAPLLPVSVQDNYLKKARQEGIELPSIYSGAIEINSEYTNAISDMSRIQVITEENIEDEIYSNFPVLNTEIPKVPDRKLARSPSTTTISMTPDSVTHERKIEASPTFTYETSSPRGNRSRMTKTFPAGIQDYSDGQMKYQMNRMAGFM